MSSPSFEGFLRGIPRFTFAFAGTTNEMENTSAYWQSLGVIASSGALVAVLLLVSWPLIACCRRCCCKDKGPGGDDEEGLSAVLYKGSGLEQQEPKVTTSRCARCCYFVTLVLMLVGTAAGVVLTFVGNVEVSRTVTQVADLLSAVGGVMTTISDAAAAISTEGAELVATADALTADPGCVTPTACFDMIEQLNTLAEEFGPEGAAGEALGGIVELVAMPADYASQAPDLASTYDELRAIGVWCFGCVVLLACVGGAIRSFCMNVKKADGSSSDCSCAQVLCACVFVPLLWASLVLSWIAAGAHLGIATVLADFCFLGTEGVVNLIPGGDGGGGGPGSRPTFRYFLACPEGEDSPFAAVITTALVAIPPPTGGDFSQEDIVAATATGGDSAAALGLTLAAPDTGHLAQLSAGLTALEALVDCTDGGAEIPQSWVNITAAICETVRLAILIYQSRACISLLISCLLHCRAPTTRWRLLTG